MNLGHHKITRVIFIYIFVLLLTSPAFSFSQTQQDLLRPCTNELMGMDTINDYNDLLRKHLFTEEDVDEPGNLVKLIVHPSFEEEQYLVIYKTRKGPYRLEYSQPSASIWDSTHYAKIPEKYRDTITKIEDIKIQTHRKTISEDLAKSISRVWWEMIRAQQFPSGNSFMIDGTMYIFSSGVGVCGMCFGGEGENVNSLIQIGQKLKEYSLQERTSQETETTIMQLANQLYKKIQPNKEIKRDN